MSDELKSKCETGCIHFEGGEIAHFNDGIYYPESRTKMYHDVCRERDDLEEKLRVALKMCEEMAAPLTCIAECSKCGHELFDAIVKAETFTLCLQRAKSTLSRKIVGADQL